MSKNYYNMAFQLFLLVVLLFFLILIGVGMANAASIRACYKDLHPDTANVYLYIGGVKTDSVFPGQTQVDGSICGTISPLPAVTIRGTLQTYTLRAANAAGEESVTASNAISFRYPQVPGAPTLLSIGASVP